MDNTFRKFCRYNLTGGTEEELKKLQETTKDKFKSLKKKANKFTKKIKNQTNKLGHKTDFEGFCNLLEEYINKKDNMTDEEKTSYLKLLMTLSEIHEVNLREELERYVSYKKAPDTQETKKEIFNKFCFYNLNKDSNTEEYNELKELATKNNLDFKELQKESLLFIEEIRILAEEIGYEINTDSFDIIMKDYLDIKNKLSDYEKSRYLKILLYLSEILKINLREILVNKKNEEIKTKEKNNESNFLKSLSNPLDNIELLSEMLNQRYNNGYFEIGELYLPFETQPKESKKYDYLKMQADITYKLYRIFLERFNNYAFTNLNPKYSNLITETDLEKLENLTRENIYEILLNINKRESAHYICRKFKITENLYKFIELSSLETTDIKKEHIGIGDNSLFNNDNEISTIEISLNGPDFETNLLLNEYIKKCVENNLNYDMSGFNENIEYRNKSILYANTKDLHSKLKILDEIINKYPNWTKEFKTPILSSCTINKSIYGISHNGISNTDNTQLQSYQEYFNAISEISYYRILAKIVIGVITDENVKYTINNFVNLNNIIWTEYKNPLLALYNNVNFETIKDLINQYIPLVSSTINIYMSDKNKKLELISEFKKSIQYISNICQNKDKKSNSNIAINEIMEKEL